MSSMLSPNIVEKYFPENIYNDPTLIITAIGKKQTEHKAKIPAFKEFNSNINLNFIVFKFHNHFDGLLGLNELRNLKFTVDLVKNELKNENTKIPILYKINREHYTISVDAYEIVAMQVPVDHSNGEVIVPEMKYGELDFRETLTLSCNGLAKTEIVNNTDKRITITLTEPIKVFPLTERHKNNLEFFLCNEFNELFYGENQKLSLTNKLKHKIKTTGTLNQNADALSRIEINVTEHNQNLSDNSSMSGEPGDINQITKNFLENLIEPIDDANHELDELLSTINLTDTDREQARQHIGINDDQIIVTQQNELDNQNNSPDDDIETIHSSAENPILEIPFTENLTNSYNRQIIIKQGKTHFHVTNTKHFENKLRITAYLTNNEISSQIINLFKNYIDPKKLYCLHVHSTITIDLIPLIITTLQNTFKNHSYNLVISRKFVTDVQEVDERENLIKYHHETKTCHRGINETQTALRNKYYWPDLNSDITRYINLCDICNQAKYDRHPPKVKFSLTVTPTKPFETIHIDVFQIMKTKFLTILDSFSKYGQAYVIEPILNSATIIECLSIFVSHFGIPYSIVSDSGTEFKSELLQEFCKLHKIRIHFTTPQNSNSNSPVERFHSSLLENCRVLKLQHPNMHIKQIVQFGVIGYNSSIHSVTGHRPYDIILGNTKALDPFDLTDEYLISEYINERKIRLKTLYQHIFDKTVQQKEKVIGNRNETRENPTVYTEGQEIFVKNREATRNKSKPRFVKHSVNKDLGNKILITKNRTIHKSKVKKPYANIRLSLQNDRNVDDNTPDPQPSTSGCNKK